MDHGGSRCRAGASTVGARAVIVDAIGGALVSVAEFVVGALPDAGTLSGFEAVGQAAGLAKRFDVGLPVTETLAMAGVSLLIIGGIFATRLVLLIYDRLPFKFT